MAALSAGNVRSGPLRSVRMHAMLTRAQVSDIRDVRGGDRARLAVLTRNGVKLVGRWGVDARCMQLLVEVLRCVHTSECVFVCVPFYACEGAEVRACKGVCLVCACVCVCLCMLALWRC